MLTLSPSIRLYLSLAPADMRRSVDGLSALVRSACGEEPLSGHLFLFRNRRGDRLKALWWDRNGYALWYKRLERGRFSFPPVSEGRVVISPETFQLLVGGLSLERLWKSDKYRHLDTCAGRNAVDTSGHDAARDNRGKPQGNRGGALGERGAPRGE